MAPPGPLSSPPGSFDGDGCVLDVDVNVADDALGVSDGSGFSEGSCVRCGFGEGLVRPSWSVGTTRTGPEGSPILLPATANALIEIPTASATPTSAQSAVRILGSMTATVRPCWKERVKTWPLGTTR